MNTEQKQSYDLERLGAGREELYYYKSVDNVSWENLY